MSSSNTKYQPFYDIFESPIGVLYLIFAGKILAGVSFKKPTDIPMKKGIVPEPFRKELEAYFKGKKIQFNQKTRFYKGTEFERSVWNIIKKIPYGETRSYRWVAEKIGKPAAVRAVGRALSKNPIPVVVPCHRVIEANGSVGGYSSGVDVKRRLLEMEYYMKMNT